MTLTVYPLTPAHRLKLAGAFRRVPRADIGIDSAIEGQMGAAFVDDPLSPQIFQVCQGDFFCYFGGEAASPAAREMLAALRPPRLLMPSAPGWLELAADFYGKRLIETDRYLFSSEGLSQVDLGQLLKASQFDDDLQPIDLPIAQHLWSDREGFADLSAFDSPEDFIQRGIGYCMPEGEEVVGVAYSSLVSSRAIELSIFVSPEHRRKGLATALGCALVAECLRGGLDPHWDAANPESCALALKLGYRPLGSYSAFYLAD